MLSRPLTSGLGTTTCRSKRPGRSSAGSSTSGRLVAAMRMMPSFASKPSISTSSWFSVCSRSSLPPPRPAPRWRPTASISSMKMMHGAFFFACSNMSRTRLADADEHFNEVGARNGEERNVRFTGNGPSDKRLPGPRRADQKDATGDSSAEPLEFSRVAQEFDDLLQILFRFVDARDVFKRHAAMRLGEKLCARFAEAHRLAGAALHLARQEYPHADERDERQPRDEQRDEPRHVLGQRARGDGNTLAIKALHERRIARRVGVEGAAIGERAV